MEGNQGTSQVQGGCTSTSSAASAVFFLGGGWGDTSTSASASKGKAGASGGGSLALRLQFWSPPPTNMLGPETRGGVQLHFDFDLPHVIFLWGGLRWHFDFGFGFEGQGCMVPGGRGSLALRLRLWLRLPPPHRELRGQKPRAGGGVGELHFDFAFPSLWGPGPEAQGFRPTNQVTSDALRLRLPLPLGPGFLPTNPASPCPWRSKAKRPGGFLPTNQPGYFTCTSTSTST